MISEKIPRSGILYLHLKDVVESFDDPINHQYNPHVIQALNTIAYIGGESVANLFVGPKSYGQGLNGKGHFTTIKGNFYGPSKSTRLKHQAGYTTKSGIYCPLLKSFLILCANTDDSMPFYRSNHVKVYATVVENDGTALKAGLRFDERLKTIVGLEETIIDHQYILDNPVPSPEFLKSKLITEALVIMQTTLDNKIDLLIGVQYVAKKGKTGEEMFKQCTEQSILAQTCLHCLQHRSEITDHVLIHTDCNSFCERCWDLKEVCEDCASLGHTSIYPQLRPCWVCLTSEQTCIKSMVMVYVTDCEEGNKKSMLTIHQHHNNGTLNPQLAFFIAIPDAVHVGKSIKASIANWYIIINGQRCCLAIL